ncbi:MAG: hypothetical protein WBA61_07830 [Aequorivita sp.]
MKLIYLPVFLVVFALIGCQSKMDKLSNGQEAEISRDSLELTNVPSEDYFDEGMSMDEPDYSVDPTTTLYFDSAFIYEYTTEEGEREEFWIYHNTENGQLLYMPDDPMIEFVVSDPLGNYYFFGDDGHGTKTVDGVNVSWVNDPELYDENENYPISDRYVTIKKTGKTKVLSDDTIDGEGYACEEYKWDFHQVAGSQKVYVTEMIPVNFYQVYGFNKLEGDIQLPVVSFDFTGIFGKNQVITQVIDGGTNLELKHYQHNPAYVEAGDYKYSIQQADGSWKETHFPLLKKK